jgi:hypothetical protein
VRAATAGHLIVQPHIPVERVQVGETSQGVHELHRPHSHALNHHEARPESGSAAGTHSSQHHDGRGMEPLFPQLRTELSFQRIRRNTLSVNRYHWQDDGIQVRLSG